MREAIKYGARGSLRTRGSRVEGAIISPREARLNSTSAILQYSKFGLTRRRQGAAVFNRFAHSAGPGLKMVVGGWRLERPKSMDGCGWLAFGESQIGGLLWAGRSKGMPNDRIFENCLDIFVESQTGRYHLG